MLQGTKSANAVHPRGGYRKPIIIIAPILDHKDGHYVRSNRVALKQPDLKKNVDPYDHVKVFNFVVKVNAETYEEYIINAFSYMLKDTTSNQCHNYMSEFFDYIFLEFTQAFCKCHWKTQNEEQIYMELKNMKHKKIERVEVYYERIQKLVHGL